MGTASRLSASWRAPWLHRFVNLGCCDPPMVSKRGHPMPTVPGLAQCRCLQVCVVQSSVPSSHAQLCHHSWSTCWVSPGRSMRLLQAIPDSPWQPRLSSFPIPLSQAQAGLSKVAVMMSGVRESEGVQTPTTWETVLSTQQAIRLGVQCVWFPLAGTHLPSLTHQDLPLPAEPGCRYTLLCLPTSLSQTVSR